MEADLMGAFVPESSLIPPLPPVPERRDVRVSFGPPERVSTKDLDGRWTLEWMRKRFVTWVDRDGRLMGLWSWVDNRSDS